MTKPVKRVPLWSSGLSLAALVATGALLGWLGTESGSQWLLRRVQESTLKSRGLTLTFDSGEFRLFSGFRFRNLRATWGKATDASHGELSAQLIELRYALSPFARELSVESFVVEKTRLRAVANLATEPSTTETEPSSGDPIASLRAFVHSPPLTVRVQRASLKDLSLDVDLKSAGTRLRATLQDLNASFSMALEPGRIDAGAEASLGQGATIALDQTDAATMAQRSISLALATRFSGQIEAREDGPTLTIALKQLTAETNLKNLRIQTTAPSKTTMQAAEVSVRMKAALAGRLGPGNTDRGVTAADADAVVIARDLSSIQSADGKPTKRFALKRATAQFKADLQKELTASVALNAIGAQASGLLLKPLDSNVVFRTVATRDGKSAKIDGTLTLGDVRTASWTGEVTRPSDAVKGTTAIDMKVDATADARLARLIAPAASLAKMGSPVTHATLNARIPDSFERMEFRVAAIVPRIVLPASAKPFALEFSGDGAWTTTARKLDVDGGIRSANSDFGRWRVGTRSNISVTDTGLLSEGQTEVAQIQLGAKSPAELPKPISATHSFSKRGDVIEAHLSAEIPLVRSSQFGQAEDGHLKAAFKTPDASKGSIQEVEVDYEQGRISLATPLGMSQLPLSGANFRMRASLRDKSAFNIESMRGSINGTLLSFSGDARGNIQTKDVLARMAFSAQFPKDFPEIAGQRLRGSIIAPFDIVLRRGREAAITGEIEFDDISWQKGPFAARGLSGRVPISEKIALVEGGMKFAGLIDQNPFERVNFERLRPLMQRTQQLSIARIEWHEKSYGPFVGFFSVRQNMAFAHQFDLDLGAGRVYGELFFDAYPRSLRVGALTRLTGLDLGKFLPERFLGRLPSGDRTLSGRTGVVFDLNKATVDGRIDVTSIGSPQLTAMINVLDPRFEDEKLNTARSALELGYPTGVGILFRQGYMDMDIDLKALGISQRQSLRSIPLSNLISAATSDVLNKTRKGPIK